MHVEYVRKMLMRVWVSFSGADGDNFSVGGSDNQVAGRCDAVRIAEEVKAKPRQQIEGNPGPVGEEIGRGDAN